MSERPHYLGHRQRLRERFLKDPKNIPDYEVLELLLGFVIPRKDTKPLAKELLLRFKTVRAALQARPEQLEKISGVGPALCAFWEVLREMRARYEESPLKTHVVVDSPKVVAELAMARLGDQAEEEVWIAMLDNSNRLTEWRQVSKGTVDQAPMYTREVMGLALEHKASGIILVHNHPGGNPNPSKQDVEITQRLSRSARDLGIRLLDHLIIAEYDYYSFQAQGML